MKERQLLQSNPTRLTRRMDDSTHLGSGPPRRLEAEHLVEQVDEARQEARVVLLELARDAGRHEARAQVRGRLAGDLARRHIVLRARRAGARGKSAELELDDDDAEGEEPEERWTHRLLDVEKVEAVVKVLVVEPRLADQLVVELALGLHDEEEHVIVSAAGEEDPASARVSAGAREEGREEGRGRSACCTSATSLTSRTRRGEREDSLAGVELVEGAGDGPHVERAVVRQAENCTRAAPVSPVPAELSRTLVIEDEVQNQRGGRGTH